MVASIETAVKQWGQIRSLGWNIIASENETADASIDASLKTNPSKTNGDGGGRPDYTVMLDNGDKVVPVFVEYKGSKGKLEKLDKQSLVVLRDDLGAFDYKQAIPKFAVNGAAYYAMNVVKDTEYAEAVALGVNGVKNSANDIIYVSRAVLKCSFGRADVFLDFQPQAALL